jgi:UDP-N-acetylglucosamine--N-acetylmuramyl-(pentapeptide) pyrophosphoryl-undecaprenol N-acetylglucosamine transferase
MLRVIISGGGTGGHVFPAIAIANAILKKDKEAAILFIGANGKMEMERVPAAGFLIKGLPISGFQRHSIWKNILLPFRILASFILGYSIIRQFKPDVVIGVGGYASGPTLKLAGMMKIPTLIQEQNSYPGMTNRMLAKKASKICVAYEGLQQFFPSEKIVFTGNPVRQDLINLEGKKEEAVAFFHVDPAKKTLLVLGGSLGAGTINKSVKDCVDRDITDRGIQIIWQTGRYYYDDILSNFYGLRKQGVFIYPFIERMDLAYAAADLIVSRAGAIAISELCVVSKPAILIPSPNVAEDHQTRNAEALSKKNAALLIRDDVAIKDLHTTILNVFSATELKEELSRNISLLAIPDASMRIADEVINLTLKK